MNFVQVKTWFNKKEHKFFFVILENYASSTHTMAKIEMPGWELIPLEMCKQTWLLFILWNFSLL